MDEYFWARHPIGFVPVDRLTRPRLMRRIGFAPWEGYPRIDDRTQDDETFHQQAQRLRPILALPDDEDAETFVTGCVSPSR
jgi:hypothetical protein